MKKADVVRAWRDAEFRSSLSSEDLESLPANPAGVVELADDVLMSITGGCANSQCSCGGGGGFGTTAAFSCVTPPQACP